MNQAESGQARYSAFISYSHQDAAFAARLQRCIETFRFPRTLAQSLGMDRLRPVFRDRDELTAGPDLDAVVRAALADSDWLIVVCSPDAARSDWVGREIEAFRAAKGQRRILTALASGDERDAFPPALFAGDGAPQPLAADFRRDGDGWRHGLLKLVAALAGVRLDDLVRRDAQRRVRRVRAVSAATMLGTAAAAVLATATMTARAAAEAEQARAVANIDYQLNVLRPKLQAAGRLDLLAEHCKSNARYFEGQRLDRLKRVQRLQLAKLLQACGSDDVDAGRLELAKGGFVRAYGLTRDVLDHRPKDRDAIFAHAQSEYYIGFIAWKLRRVPLARLSFERYAAMADRLLALDPNDPDARLETAYAQSNLGTLLLRETNDLAGTRRTFLKAQTAMDAVARQRPDDLNLRVEIADGYSWLARVEAAARNRDQALMYRQRQETILRELLARDPRNARYQAGLLVALMGKARIADDLGAIPAADDRWQEARRLADQLANADPANAQIARQRRTVLLLQARNQLMGRPRSASLSTISSMIGRCMGSDQSMEGRELSLLCALTRARWLIAAGELTQASELLQKTDSQISVPRLATIWRLDLANERQRLLDSIKQEQGTLI